MCFIQLREFLYVPSLLKFFLGIDAELGPGPPVHLSRWLCCARSGQGSLSSLDMELHVFPQFGNVFPFSPGTLPHCVVPAGLRLCSFLFIFCCFKTRKSQFTYLRVFYEIIL